jgi:predicted transcriptional regulator
MEIKSRGVDPTAVKKIDELAKAQSISRSTFIANMIQNYTALEEFKDFEKRYQDFIDKSLRVIERNTDVMQKVLDIVGDSE